MVMGSWSGVIDIPVFAVHAAVVYNSTTAKWKVILFSGGAEESDPPTGVEDRRRSYLWDPETNTFSAQPFYLDGPSDDSDPFCAHHCLLADGRLLVMGGALYGGADTYGIKATWLFDPVLETWSRAGPMAFDRWYPTSVMLGDGRVLVMSGVRWTALPDDIFMMTEIIEQVEVFDPATNRWSQHPPSANKTLEIYPSLHLVPAGPHVGKIFYTGTRWAGGDDVDNTWNRPHGTALFDPITNTWENVGNHNTVNRTEGFSVLLPPAELARFLVFGGGHLQPDGDPSSTEFIDLLQPNPQWTDVQSMHHHRTNVSGVILPNGTVFVFGGHSADKGYADSSEHVLIGEIYEPSLSGWVETASMARPRQYHSVGVLLPDGMVLCAGGTSLEIQLPDQRTMEIFSPQYMDELNRPEITAAPTEIGYGSFYRITSPRAGSIRDVALIRPMAITHHTDSEQRYVRLQFHAFNDHTLSFWAPANSNLAPPGYYMLFLVDVGGVPSVATFVKVRKPTWLENLRKRLDRLTAPFRRLLGIPTISAS